MEYLRSLSDFEREAIQAEGDARHEVDRFTGTDFDVITLDYAVYLNGRVIGYAPTPEAGRRLLAGIA